MFVVLFSILSLVFYLVELSSAIRQLTQLPAAPVLTDVTIGGRFFMDLRLVLFLEI
jgi:hypothetical protein